MEQIFAVEAEIMEGIVVSLTKIPQYLTDILDRNNRNDGSRRYKL
jgi:hypothetical protein